MKAQIINDLAIAFDGINIHYFKAGQQVNLDEPQFNRLIELNCVVAIDDSDVSNFENKVVNIEIKEKPKRKK